MPLISDEAFPNAALTAWAPESWAVAGEWQPLVNHCLAGSAAHHLGDFIRQRLAAHAVIYPPQPLQALALTSLAEVRVVSLGQDPYHGPGQAHGLAFSVAEDVRLPPSLRNIFKEISRDGLARSPYPPGVGCLVRWAQQGVLLLNTCLSVEQGLPASHANRGWEELTNGIIRGVASKAGPVVFMLWGAHAQGRLAQIQAALAFAPPPGHPPRHLVLTANHPSPLSALRGPNPYIGCGHFSRANQFLEEQGMAPVVW